MKTSFSRFSFLPASLFMRMALILLLGVLAAQSLSIWLYWGERTAVVNETRGMHVAEIVAEAIRQLEAVPPEQRRDAAAGLRSGGLRAEPISAEQVQPHAPRGRFQSNIAARLGSAREIHAAGGMGRMMMHQENGIHPIDVRLRDGEWVRLTLSQDSGVPAWPQAFYLHLLLSLAIVVAVAMLAVRQAARPLQRFAEAADSFGKNLDAQPLPETGSTETRTAAHAFNRMRDRIKRLIGERSRALAAVSHDLRTPPTRLRLRSELIENDRLREQMIADIDGMAQMIDSTLDHLRGIGENEALRPIDIDALLSTLAEDSATQDRRILVEGQALAPYPGRFTALRRAVQNLIDNACKHGSTPRIQIADDEKALRLCVEDDGPGISPEILERIRGASERNMSGYAVSSGRGLGLSIVKDIALLHGGEFVIENRPQGGVSATLVLPRKTA